MLAQAAIAAMLTVTPPAPPADIATPRLWKALATCETGFNLAHNQPSYISALGMSRGTFARWGGRYADTKSWQRTMAIAERVAWYGYTTPKGEYVYPVGPWGWGCLRKHSYAHQVLCASKKPEVRRWRRYC